MTGRERGTQASSLFRWAIVSGIIFGAVLFVPVLCTFDPLTFEGAVYLLGMIPFLVMGGGTGAVVALVLYPITRLLLSGRPRSAINWYVAVPTTISSIASGQIIGFHTLTDLLVAMAVVSGIYLTLSFATSLAVPSLREHGSGHEECDQCGYDRFGSSSRRCPECGWERTAHEQNAASAQNDGAGSGKK